MLYLRYLDTMWLFKSYPEYLAENYDETTIKKIRKDPKSWLNSLPMVEYAHVLTVYTSHLLGGDPKKYVRVLYSRMLANILKRYYLELEWYRFNRSVRARNYWSTFKMAPREGVIQMRSKMGFCTCKCRELMCCICEEFKWLKDLPDDHPKTIMLINELEDMAKDTQLIEWQERLEAFLEDLKNKDTTGYPGDDSGDDNPGEDTDDPGTDPDPSDPSQEEPDPDPVDPGGNSCNCNGGCNGNCA